MELALGLATAIGFSVGLTDILTEWSTTFAGVSMVGFAADLPGVASYLKIGSGLVSAS